MKPFPRACFSPQRSACRHRAASAKIVDVARKRYLACEAESTESCGQSLGLVH